MSAASAPAAEDGAHAVAAGEASAPGAPRRGWLQLFAGTACWILAFPPVGLWPLACLVPPLLALAARAAPGARAAFLRLSLAGLLAYAIGMHWIAETALANLVMVAVVEAPLVGLFGWLARRVLPGRRAALWVPVLWVGLEMLRFSWPLSGLTWLGLGHAWAASPLLVQVADLGGVTLVSLVAAATGSALVARATGRGWPEALPGLTLLALTAVYGLVAPGLHEPTGPGPLVATLQPAFPQQLKDDPLAAEARWAVLMELVDEVAARGSPDLLVFPETMWPYPPLLLRPERLGGVPAELSDADRAVLEPAVARDAQFQRQLVERVRAPFGERPPALLLGCLVRYVWGVGEDAAGLANGALLIAADGEPSASMEKRELVPGGETLPLISWMPEDMQDGYRRKVREFAGYVPDLLRGPPVEPLAGPGGLFGVTICYENAYGALGRRLSERGARWLVNLSNEGWFGRSAEFDHMELQSILRAVETRRALFRSTNSGVSCLVLPDGRAPEGSRRLELGGRDRELRGSFLARVPLHDGQTLYRRLGDLVGWLALAGAALGVYRGPSRHSRAAVP